MELVIIPDESLAIANRARDAFAAWAAMAPMNHHLLKGLDIVLVQILVSSNDRLVKTKITIQIPLRDCVTV